MSIRELVKRTLVNREDIRYGKRLQKKQTVYGEWAAGQEAGQGIVQKGICPDFAVFCMGKGRMAAGAWEAMAAYFAENQEVRILYGDEDVWGSGGEGADALADRRLPWYKPDWSPDFLDSFFYFGSVAAVERGLLQKAGFSPEKFGVREAPYGWSASGRPAPDGSGDTAVFTKTPRACGGGSQQFPAFYEVTDFETYERAVHACIELAGGYGKGASCVGHVQRILFHGESGEEQEKFFRPSPFLESLKEAGLQALGRTLAAEKKDSPYLSVVIPSKDHPEALEACVKSCLDAAGRGLSLPFEILVVDNGSSKENRTRVEDMAGRLPGHGSCRIRYLYRPMEFNFSKMCNLGASQAEGRLLLFLNDDVTLCQKGTLAQMAALADREGTGAVGLKLYYPDSVRIQHAGITNLPMGPVHKLQFCQDDRRYYYGANQGSRNVLAVTAACLMVGREKFQEAGGFSEELKVAFNDVELCFSLHEAGYRNVCVNGLHGFHHESLSRGDDESEEKLERLLEEREKLYAAHPDLEGVDPFYSSFLNREGLDTGIRPACVTAGNTVQRISAISAFPGEKAYRMDACLMVRIEDCRRQRIIGCGVVLGDDNACYDRMLLLKEDMEQSSSQAGIYAAGLEEMYRPDLEENMPDQRNVALCGFDIKIGAGILHGRYRLGMAVRNRVTGLKLINWSSRFITLD